MNNSLKRLWDTLKVTLIIFAIIILGFTIFSIILANYLTVDGVNDVLKAFGEVSVEGIIFSLKTSLFHILYIAIVIFSVVLFLNTLLEKKIENKMLLNIINFFGSILSLYLINNDYLSMYTILIILIIVDMLVNISKSKNYSKREVLKYLLTSLIMFAIVFFATTIFQICITEFYFNGTYGKSYYEIPYRYLLILSIVLFIGYSLFMLYNKKKTIKMNKTLNKFKESKPKKSSKL